MAAFDFAVVECSFCCVLVFDYIEFVVVVSPFKRVSSSNASRCNNSLIT